MNKIAVTGISGVIGLQLKKSLNEDQFISLTRRRDLINNSSVHFLDLLRPETVVPVLKKIKPSIIIHLAAITHIDACEIEKWKGKDSKTWIVNVEATKKIVNYCKESGCKLIYLSTECVFDGKRGNYKEDDLKKPINWYGYSKAKAEEIILDAPINSAIIRGVITYYLEKEGETIFGKFYKQLKKGIYFPTVFDQLISPSYTPDIVKAIKKIILKELTGIYHIAPNEAISPYQFSNAIAEKFNYSKKIISAKSLKGYFGEEKGKIRLKNATLSSKKTQQALGFIPTNIYQLLESTAL